ncbi:lipoprotein-releasing ABC transporter permease subunit [Acidobacteriota bacterium]
MNFERFIAFRYLKAKRKQTYISVITIISILCVIVGSMALVIALALMTGFASDIQDKILGAEAHIFVYSLDLNQIQNYRELSNTIEQMPHVVAVSPNVHDEVMLVGPLGTEPALLKGVDPASESRVSDLPGKMIDGSFSDLERPGKRVGIVLGIELAQSLHVLRGDQVRVVSMEGPMTPVGIRPRIKTFEVRGIFDSGMYEFDKTWALVDLKALQDMLRMGDSVTILKIRLDSIDHLDEITEVIATSLGSDYRVRNLVDLNRPLFAALKLEKLLMFLTISLIVVVAALNIVTTLVMMVMEKSRDVAILRAMGANAKSIMWVFILQGLIIGLTGTLIGCTVGIVSCYLFDHYQIFKLDTRVYYIPYLPFKVRFLDMGLVAGVAVLISFLATIYPAWSAAKLDPVEALRYE